jgi:hypothetical protein
LPPSVSAPRPTRSPVASGKGYPAFVTTAGANFRVRVGKFDDRREAERMAGRLEREEQFKPWITR